MPLFRITLILICFFISNNLAAQDQSKCMEIVELTMESINSQSIDIIKPHLSKSFSIAGQEEPVATIVLQKLVGTLSDKVKAIEQTNAELGEELVLTYEFLYENRGATETKFFFNAEDKLTKLELFKMEVKTMNSEDTKITTSELDVLTVPIEMRGDLMVADVLLNGIKRKFIIDTGAPKVILNENYISDLEYSKQKINISSSKSVNGSISGLDLHLIEILDFHGIQMKNQKVLTLDLSGLEKEYEMEIYGLIGYELLKEYDILFNYEKNEMQLVKPDYFDTFQKEMTHLTNPTRLQFSMEKHLPVIDCYIGQKKLAFAIDSGAESNLIDKSLFDQLYHSLDEIASDTLTGAGKISREVPTGSLKSLKFGSLIFPNMHTVFSDISHLNEGYSMNINGILGYEFLSIQPVLISYLRKEIIFYDKYAFKK